jgi:hypothetical protein
MLKKVIDHGWTTYRKLTNENVKDNSTHGFPFLIQHSSVAAFFLKASIKCILPKVYTKM